MVECTDAHWPVVLTYANAEILPDDADAWARFDARCAQRALEQHAEFVYVMESNRDAWDELPDSHRWNSATRYLAHHPDDGRKHRPTRVPFKARVYIQRAYVMGRGSRRGDAD